MACFVQCNRDRVREQSVAAALRRFEGHLHVAAVSSDRLYPVRLSEEIAQSRPGTVLSIIESRHGHDGFLIETGQVGRVIDAALRAP